jgi:hypothetical protein
MKDTNMTTTPRHSPRFSRRVFLGAMMAGAGLIGLPFSLRAAPGETGPAVAFDGDALILAEGTLSRSDGGGGWIELPVPASGGILSLATHPGRLGRVAAGLTRGGHRPLRRWRARLGGEKRGLARRPGNSSHRGGG